ncbi:MAG: DHHA1 domain-containing protein [Anaerolineae bacterium]
MANRLYYDDSYTTEFTAAVVERLTFANAPAVVLDATYFYPTAGGQPHDTGTLNAARVINVASRDSDGAVIHVLDRELEGDTVTAKIDWARRFDLMQNHTGQHILTQAFVQAAGANTVSFHLSDDSVTIDLDQTNLPTDKITAAEDLANRIVQENRAISVRLIDPNDAESVRIRKIPERMFTNGLRVVEVAGFDVTACGGTHVRHTGEIAMIKVIRLERRGDKTRVEFRCGGRALRDYREKNAIVNQLTADLTCAAHEIGQALGKLRDDLKGTQSALKASSTRLIEYEARELLEQAPQYDELCVVTAAFDGRDVGELKLLASKLTEQAGTIALLGSAGEKAQILCARSKELPYDMNPLLKAGLVLLNGRGGGRPEMAQGGGVAATVEQIQAALAAAKQAIWA